MTTYRRIMVLVLLVASLTVADSGSCYGQQLENIIANSVSGFSGAQGSNGWWYGYWDQSADDNKVYDQKDDFRLLGHFGDDKVNGLSRHTEFNTGKLWYLEDGIYYTSMWAEGGHPHGTMDLGHYSKAEHWVVRRWTSTTEGRVTIHGHAGKAMPWGENWSGTVKFLIVVDGSRVFESEVEDGGLGYAASASVHVGSQVDFLIGPGSAIGVIKFTATIASDSESPT